MFLNLLGNILVAATNQAICRVTTLLRVSREDCENPPADLKVIRSQLCYYYTNPHLLSIILSLFF